MKKLIYPIAAALVMGALTSCNWTVGASSARSNVNSSIFTPPQTGSLPTPPATAARQFSSCSGIQGTQCLGLKIVAYEDGSAPVLNADSAKRLVDEINSVWAPCGIAFQIDSFETVNPVERGLSFSPNWRTDSTAIRSAFDDSRTFLIVAVGPWSTSTIAVTEMPGYGPFGTLVRKITQKTH